MKYPVNDHCGRLKLKAAVKSWQIAWSVHVAPTAGQESWGIDAPTLSGLNGGQLPLGTSGHLGVQEKALWPQDAEAGSWKPAGLRGSGKT